MTRLVDAAQSLVLAYDTTVDAGERPHDVTARRAAAGLNVFCACCGPLARGARPTDAEVLAASHVEHWQRRRTEARSDTATSGVPVRS